ncbi:MAG: TIGR00268 family protein, partial [Verrucomicrobiota bacterium]
DKPAFACLGSRFPYGDRTTEEKLKAVDALEAVLRKLRFRQLRVRHHGEIARIEVEPTEIERLASEPVRTQVLEAGRRAGFQYVALDLQGYRTGSMNETL